MKANLLALLTTLLITHLSLSARIVEVSGYGGYEQDYDTYPPTIRINANESCRVMSARGHGYHSRGSVYWIQETSEGNLTSEILYVIQKSNYPPSYSSPSPLILDGPGWIKAGSDSYGSTFSYATATVEILPTSEMQKYLPGGGGSSSSSSASGEQKNVTVIPENTPSNVQITLEQSTDLVNWSVVQPGSFAPSTTKRFFRIRSEQE